MDRFFWDLLRYKNIAFSSGVVLEKAELSDK